LNVETIVVGAGIAGLAAAAELRRSGREVLILEAAPDPGGVAQTETVRGYRLERGPNTFRVGPPLARFLEHHELVPLVARARPVSRKRYLLRGRTLIPVPDGLGAFVRTPLLSGAGKRRLLAEPFVRRGDARGESVAEFISRRMGNEVLAAFVGPFLTGVYAGEETQLGAQAVFPAWVDAERRRGSVALGLLTRRERGGWRGTWSGRCGLGSLVTGLAQRVGASLRCGAPVASAVFETDAHRYRIELESGEILSAARLIVATAAAQAASLLKTLDARLSGELDAIRYAPLVSLSLGVASDGLRRRVEGFGYLVPRGEGDLVLGCLFPSQLFPERAPAGRELLTVLVGGERCPEAVGWPEEQLRSAVLRELDSVLEFRDTPEWLALSRWPRGVPQPGRDHPARVRRIGETLQRFPNIALAGGYLEGVAFGDALVSGARAARSTVAEDPR